jgi:hypothetical protein
MRRPERFPEVVCVRLSAGQKRRIGAAAADAGKAVAVWMREQLILAAGPPKTRGRQSARRPRMTAPQLPERYEVR